MQLTRMKAPHWFQVSHDKARLVAAPQKIAHLFEGEPLQFDHGLKLFGTGLSVEAFQESP
jgi:hypothetical protein